MKLKNLLMIKPKQLLFLFLCVGFNQTVILSQSLREKIGQMVWVSFNGTKLDDSVKTDLKKRNVGGIILFAGNISNPIQVKTLIDSIKSYSKTPSFVAVDQEGGKVARLSSSNGFSDSYTAYTLGTTFNNEDSTRKSAATMAGWLKQCGFNVNLAPVADVNVNPASPAIGKLGRSFSQIPENVFKHDQWFINEFNKKNILTCLKHFPGHGSAAQDSHLGFTDISNTWTNSELLPYQQLFKSGYQDIVMMGHLYNSYLDPVYPASLSKKVVSELLRTQLGFNGTVITDGMAMQAITANYSFENAVEYAVNAGDDILLYTTNIRNGSSLVKNVIDIIEQKINQGKISAIRIDESYKRIIQLKTKYGLITSIKEFVQSNIPEKFQLYQNYPNPFNPSTSISFQINERAFISLVVFNSIGQIVSNLINEEISPGVHEIKFNGTLLSSGVYYYRLRVGNSIQTKKMLLIK